MGWKELPKWAKVSIYILVISIILKIIASFLPRSTNPLGAILSIPLTLISPVLGVLFLALPILFAFTIFKNERKRIKSFAKGFLLASLFALILGGTYFVLCFFSIVSPGGGGYEIMLLGLWIIIELIIGLILLFIGRFVKGEPIAQQ